MQGCEAMNMGVQVQWHEFIQDAIAKKKRVDLRNACHKVFHDPSRTIQRLLNVIRSELQQVPEATKQVCEILSRYTTLVNQRVHQGMPASEIIRILVNSVQKKLANITAENSSYTLPVHLQELQDILSAVNAVVSHAKDCKMGRWITREEQIDWDCDQQMILAREAYMMALDAPPAEWTLITDFLSSETPITYPAAAQLKHELDTNCIAQRAAIERGRQQSKYNIPPPDDSRVQEPSSWA
jgi:hypothetical protein